MARHRERRARCGQERSSRTRQSPIVPLASLRSFAHRSSSTTSGCDRWTGALLLPHGSGRVLAAGADACSGRDPGVRRRAIHPVVAPATVETRQPRRRWRVPCPCPHLRAPCRTTIGAAAFESATSRVSDSASLAGPLMCGPPPPCEFSGPTDSPTPSLAGSCCHHKMAANGTFWDGCGGFRTCDLSRVKHGVRGGSEHENACKYASFGGLAGASRRA
jgi:hypothetical protein